MSERLTHLSDEELDELIDSAKNERSRRIQKGDNAKAVEILVEEAGWTKAKADRYVELCQSHSLVTSPDGKELLDMAGELDSLRLLSRVRKLTNPMSID